MNYIHTENSCVFPTKENQSIVSVVYCEFSKMECTKTVLIALLIVSYSGYVLSYFCENFEKEIEIFSEPCYPFLFPLNRKSYDCDSNFDNPGLTNNFYLTQNVLSCVQTKLIEIDIESVLIIYLNMQSAVDSSVLNINILDKNNVVIGNSSKILTDINDWTSIEITDFVEKGDIKVT